MSTTTLSTRYLREEIERKAYAYGVSPVVAFLLGEHAVHVLREAAAEQRPKQEPVALQA